MTVKEKNKFDKIHILDIINKTFPIPARFRSRLPADIAELSRGFTSSRSERSLSYLNKPNLLSAYLHYFLPWNILRLCALLEKTEINLSAGNTIIDLGSGPLTFASALWIAQPDLRNIPLEITCVDRSKQALDAGKKFFLTLSGDSPWKIHLIRDNIRVHELHELARIKEKKKAALVSAINLFNELYERVPHNNIEELRKVASNAAQFMCKQAEENAYILTVEPGVPQAGKFITFLREAFLELGRTPAAPCTHAEACPLYGGSRNTGNIKKWCHFACENFEPPRELARLSAAAKLPKQRLVYSYLLINSQCIMHNAQLKTPALNAIRVISDIILLPGGKTGRYGCYEKGLVLLTGEKNRMEKLLSGSIVSNYTNTNQLDAKSGAAIMEIK